MMAVAASLTAAGVGALAHHSITAVYDTTKDTIVEGVVTQFQFVNPHPLTEIKETRTSQQWRLEMDSRGELAATWFSGRGETLHGHAARLAIGDGDRAPRMIEAPPFRTDSWRFGERPEDTPERDTAGEYLALTFLRDGGVAIVSPIQNRRANRFGFSWRRLAAR